MTFVSTVAGAHRGRLATVHESCSASTCCGRGGDLAVAWCSTEHGPVVGLDFIPAMQRLPSGRRGASGQHRLKWVQGEHCGTPSRTAYLGRDRRIRAAHVRTCSARSRDGPRHTAARPRGDPRAHADHAHDAVHAGHQDLLPECGPQARDARGGKRRAYAISRIRSRAFRTADSLAGCCESGLHQWATASTALNRSPSTGA